MPAFFAWFTHDSVFFEFDLLCFDRTYTVVLFLGICLWSWVFSATL